MNEQEYYKLLHGQGQHCPNTANLVYLPKAAKTIEERSKDKICPPTKLNPDYLPTPSTTRRVGQIPPRPRQMKGGGGGRVDRVDPTVLKHIFGQ
jgi:hypothetical protein